MLQVIETSSKGKCCNYFDLEEIIYDQSILMKFRHSFVGTWLCTEQNSKEN